MRFTSLCLRTMATALLGEFHRRVGDLYVGGQTRRTLNEGPSPRAEWPVGPRFCSAGYLRKILKTLPE